MDAGARARRMCAAVVAVLVTVTVCIGGHLSAITGSRVRSGRRLGVRHALAARIAARKGFHVGEGRDQQLHHQQH